MNALAHGAEALYGPLANPVATMAALRGAALIAGASTSGARERDRAALALGSLLCAYALDGRRARLHHVVCQTLVRVLEIPHAETNATLLPRTMAAMRERAPEAIEALAAALGTDPAEGLPKRLQALGGGRPPAAGAGRRPGRESSRAIAILSRPELAGTPDPPDRAELEALVEGAW